MLARLLLSPFKSTWQLKERILATTNPWLRRALIATWQAYQYENGSSVAWNSQFAGPPCFPHGMKGIFVSGDARVGRDCVIFQQVTIGSNLLGDGRGFGAPVIGDNVLIATGARIVGGVRVGNNVRIGANAVVHEDVPDNAVVVPGKQRVIAREGPVDNRYYSRQHGAWCVFEAGDWQPVTDEQTKARLEAYQDDR